MPTQAFRQTPQCSHFPSLHRHLPDVLDEFDPDIVVYNAGTDILEGDRLGNLDITPEVYSAVHPNSRTCTFIHFDPMKTATRASACYCL